MLTACPVIPALGSRLTLQGRLYCSCRDELLTVQFSSIDSATNSLITDFDKRDSASNDDVVKENVYLIDSATDVHFSANPILQVLWAQTSR